MFSFKKIFIILFKLTVTITGIIYIINNVDYEKSFLLIQNINYEFFIFAYVILLLQLFIVVFRWRMVLVQIEEYFTPLILLRFFWIGLLVNQVFPSTIGGDTLRGYYLYKSGCKIKEAILSILLDRIFGLIGLLILVFLTIPLLFNQIDNQNAQLGLLIITIGLSLAVVMLVLLSLLSEKFLRYRFMFALKTLSIELKRMLFSFSSCSFFVTTSLCAHLFSIITVIALSRCLQLEIEMITIFLVVPFVTLFMTIPISIAGWGIREGVMVLGFGYFGVAPDQALALSILYGISLLLISLPGAGFWLLSSFSVNDVLKSKFRSLN